MAEEDDLRRSLVFGGLECGEGCYVNEQQDQSNGHVSDSVVTVVGQDDIAKVGQPQNIHEVRYIHAWVYAHVLCFAYQCYTISRTCIFSTNILSACVILRSSVVQQTKNANRFQIVVFAHPSP